MRKSTLLAATLLFVSCATLAPVADPWLPKAQRLTISATNAYVEALTRAGAAYGAIGTQCKAAHPSNAGDLYQCMKPANEARDRIEAAANKYRKTAHKILTAKSWADVLGDIETMRADALSVAREAGQLGEDPVAIRELLTQPLDAAKER